MVEVGFTVEAAGGVEVGVGVLGAGDGLARGGQDCCRTVGVVGVALDDGTGGVGEGRDRILLVAVVVDDAGAGGQGAVLEDRFVNVTGVDVFFIG